MADPAPKAPRAWNWTVYATIAAPLIIACILIWQLGQLEPQRWCSVSIDTSKEAGRPLTAIQSCFSLLSGMLAIYRQNTLALIVILGISLVTIVITTLKARVDLDAFGLHGKIEGDPTPVVVQNDAANPVPVEPRGGDNDHRE